MTKVDSTHPPVKALRVDEDSGIVDALLESYAESATAIQHVNSYVLPSTDEVKDIVEASRTLLYPGFVGPSLVRATPTELREGVRERVGDLRRLLRRQVYRGLHLKAQRDLGTNELDCPHCAADADQIAASFLERIAPLREVLATDVQAHFDGCPAATSTDEIIFCYPGLYAITVYRVAHELLDLGAKLIPRMMTEIAHERTGIDIHPGATIGRSFFIDHGSGIVVGETTRIGDRVRLYQGVTLGALSIKDRTEDPGKRHPTIEDDVVLYAGATILGGETVIGKGAVIGGNCWVTQSVPPGKTVTLLG